MPARPDGHRRRSPTRTSGLSELSGPHHRRSRRTTRGCSRSPPRSLTIGVSTPAFYPNVRRGRSFQPNQAVARRPDQRAADLRAAAGADRRRRAGLGRRVGRLGRRRRPNGAAPMSGSRSTTSTYSQIGDDHAAAAQGVLTATCRGASGWDTTDTLAVNLAESGGDADRDLAGGGAAGRDALAGRQRTARLRDRDADRRERLQSDRPRARPVRHDAAPRIRPARRSPGSTARSSIQSAGQPHRR